MKKIKTNTTEGFNHQNNLQRKDQAFFPSGKEKSFFGPVIQTKLTVGAADDSYEKEADAVADTVMRMPASSLQIPREIQPVSASHISRKCEDCEKEEKLQRKNNSDTGAGYSTNNVGTALQTRGHSLDKSTRGFMEDRFGYDFSNVQIHNDSTAHRSSSGINAKAYTHQNHVVFGEGQYQPETTQGKRLLAHELTHVVQQRSAGNLGIQRKNEEVCMKNLLFEFDAVSNSVKEKDNNGVPRLFYTQPTGKDEDIAHFYENVPLKLTPGMNLPAGAMNKFGWRRVCYSPTEGAPVMLFYVHNKYLTKVEEKKLAPEVPPPTTVPAPEPEKIKTYDELENEENAEKAKTYAETCRFVTTNATNPGNTSVPDPCHIEGLRSAAILVDEFVEVFRKALTDNAVFLLGISREAIEKQLGEFEDELKSLAMFRKMGSLANDVAIREASLNPQVGMDPSHWGGQAPEPAEEYTPEIEERIASQVETLSEEHPIFQDEEFLKAIAREKGLVNFERIGKEACKEKLKNIQTVLDELDIDPDKTFKLDTLVNYTRQKLSIEDGSVRDIVINNYAEYYTGDVADDLLNLLSLAFLAIGFIPNPIAKGVSAVGSLATGALQVRSEYYKYLFEDAAAHTDFERARSLAGEDPDLIWLAVSILSLIPDAGPIFKTLKGAAKEFKIGGKIAKFEEAVNNTSMKSTLKEKIINAARKEEKFMADEAKVINEALQKEGPAAVKALEGPVNKNLAERYKEVVPSEEAEVLYELPIKDHKIVKKMEKLNAKETWCVRTTEVCNIPVKKDIEKEIDKSIVDKGEGYLKSPKLKAPVTKGNAEAARAEFDVVRPGYVKKLQVKDAEDIHHAIELQTLDRYPGAFTAKELNDFKNMRGIPAEMETVKQGGVDVVKTRKQLHNSYIRWRWNHYYADLDNLIASKKLKPGSAAYEKFAKDYLKAGRDAIDHAVGQFFSSYKRGDMGLP